MNMSRPDDRTGLYQDLEETSSSSPYSRGHALNTGILSSEGRIKKRQNMKSNVKHCETTGIVTNIQEPFLFCAHHGESTGPVHSVHLPPRTPCAQPFPRCLCQSRKRFGPCCKTFCQLERLHKFHRLGWGVFGGGNNVGCLHLHTHTHCTWCYASLAVSWGYCKFHENLLTLLHLMLYCCCFGLEWRRAVLRRKPHCQFDKKQQAVRAVVETCRWPLSGIHSVSFMPKVCILWWMHLCNTCTVWETN